VVGTTRGWTEKANTTRLRDCWACGGTLKRNRSTENTHSSKDRLLRLPKKEKTPKERKRGSVEGRKQAFSRLS